MPAEPVPPEQQSEVMTINLMASVIEKRGSYCTEFGGALARMNAICARIFNRIDPDADLPPPAREWA